MNETPRSWSGSRWWKFDFHAHTPISDCYGQGPNQAALKQLAPRDWLLNYMRAGIDCVAVTDHNSGAWINELKSALGELAEEIPDGFRPLVLFPGMEISVNGGIHLLAILSPEKSTADLDALRGAVGFTGTPGSSDDVTSKSFTEVVEEINKAGGIAIPAHVDGPKGLFENVEGTTLKQALGCGAIFAMEVLNPDQEKPPLFVDSKVRWTEVLGSDAHHPSANSDDADGSDSRYPGSHFTWVKMGTPSLDGLRLALLDGVLSVRRSDGQTDDPNKHASKVLESIEVSKARYMGRADPFTVPLNPWLNAVIGGRGSGKSTLLEFLRIAMRRENEVPDALEGDLARYAGVYASRDEEGLQTGETRFVVTYRKDGARYRIQWSQGGDVDPIQEKNEEGSWVAAEGDIPQRFPVRIYSQKQIFQLAKEPMALLKIVDDAPEVDHRAWKEQWKVEENRFLSLRAKARELESGMTEEPRFRGELDDVTRKLAVYEGSGHADVLKVFQNRRRQQRAVEDWEKSWSDAGERIRQMADEIKPESLETDSFNLLAAPDLEFFEIAVKAEKELEEIRQSLVTLSEKVDGVGATWRVDKDSSAWQQEVDAALKAYEELKVRLAKEGVGDPSAYGELVQRRQTIERHLKDLADRRQQVEAIRVQADESLARLLGLRRQRTQDRLNFIHGVLDGNKYVQIDVLPYGADRETVEADFRRLIQREGDLSKNDIGAPDGDGLLGRLYEGGTQAQTIESALVRLKNAVREIATGQAGADSVRDQRFAKHLRNLPPEALDRLDTWFPEDSLDVQYSNPNDGLGFRSIQVGSPGQKTAALLAFLLSYGDEPLILDQPEDDLDNHLIYDLIVAQLREVKRRRQVLVVTHNANIVVNGDAELVVALEPAHGETEKECLGSLQQRKVRDTICAVMEGGREAFEQRYRRIALEPRNV